MLLVANAPGFVTVKITWEQKFYTCLQQFEYRLPSLLEPSDNFTSVSKGYFFEFLIYKKFAFCMGTSSYMILLSEREYMLQ